MSKRRRESTSPCRDSDSCDVDVVISTSTTSCDDHLEMYTYKISLRTVLARLLTEELGLERVSTIDVENDDYVSMRIAVKTKTPSDTGSDAVPFSPRRSFTRSAPKLSRVASKVQNYLRKNLGLSDFLVDIDTQDD